MGLFLRFLDFFFNILINLMNLTDTNLLDNLKMIFMWFNYNQRFPFNLEAISKYIKGIAIKNISNAVWNLIYGVSKKGTSLLVDSNQRLNDQGFIDLEQPQILYTSIFQHKSKPHFSKRGCQLDAKQNSCFYRKICNHYSVGFERILLTAHCHYICWIIDVGWGLEEFHILATSNWIL